MLKLVVNEDIISATPVYVPQCGRRDVEKSGAYELNAVARGKDRK